LELPGSADGAVLFRAGGVSVSARLEGAARAGGVVSGDTVVYPGAVPGGSLELRAGWDDVKELVTLNGPSVSSLSYVVSVSGGSPRVGRSKAVEFVDNAGKARFGFAPPVMWDASGESRSRSENLDVSLRPLRDGTWRLTVTPDAKWLADPARVWPVTIDPTTTLNTTGDCYLSNASGGTHNNCASTSLTVGQDSVGAVRRSVLKFDALGAIRPLAASGPVQISAAELGLFRTGIDTKALSLYKVTSAWNGASASWVNRDQSVPTAWTTPGGDMSAAIPGATTGLASGSGSWSTGGTGWHYWYPTQAVQEWFDGEAEYGLLLKADVENDNRDMWFASSEDATSTRRPKLRIDWETGVGERPDWTYVDTPVSPETQVRVNVANGNVLIKEADLAIRGTGIDLNLGRTYNNLATSTRDYGERWKGLGMGLRLWRYGSNERVSWEEPGGRRIAFIREIGSGVESYKALQPSDFTLKYDSAGGNVTYAVRQKQSGVTFNYDANGFLRTIKDRNSNTITYNYTGEDIASITDTQGRVTTFTYQAGSEHTRITSISDPAGRTQTFAYNSSDWMTSSTNAVTETTTYTTNGYERIDKITDARGNETRFTYVVTDPKKWRVASIKRVNNTSTGAGDTTTFTYHDNCTTDNALNDAVKCTVVTDPRGNKTIYYPKDNGQVTKVVDALRHRRDNTFTPAGNVQSYNADSTSAVYNLTYNNNDNLTQMTSPASASGQTGASSYLTYPSSGLVHQPDSSTDPQQNCQSMRFDGVGNLTEVHAGLTASSNTCAGQSSTVKYVNDYNANGTLEWQQAPGGNCTSVPKVRCTSYAYTYAAATPGPPVLQQIVVTRPSPLGTETMNFDTLGRMIKVTDGRGTVTRYTYDNVDRITQILYNNTTTCSSTTTCTTYVYDDVSNLTSRADNTGTTGFTYDTQNRLTKKDLPTAEADCSGQGGMVWTYDPAGNVKTHCDSGGTVSYQYDAVNNTCWQLLGTSANTCASPPTAAVKYAYDNDDRRTSTVYPTTPAVTMAAEYFPDGSLKKIESSKATTPTATLLTRRAYTYTVGTSDTALRRTMTDETGTVTNYGYDQHNRLCWTKTGIASGTCTSPPAGADQWLYAGTAGDNGNRTSQVVGGVTTTYQYNEADQLCWVLAGTSANNCATIPSGAGVPSYDGAGNETTRYNGQTAAYNDKNQTSSFTASGTTTTATYADADSSERTAFGGTSFYNSPQGINMTRTNSTNTYYSRDDQGTLVSQRVGSAGAQRYYIFDGLGSVIAMVNGAGGVDQTYIYDVWGNIAASSGSVANPFRYVSGLFDSQSGLTKFGTRYYEPALGRWTQLDPSGADHGYAYSSSDPCNRTDPSGYHSSQPHAACRGWWYTAVKAASYGGLIRGIWWYPQSGQHRRALSEGLGWSGGISVSAIGRAAGGALLKATGVVSGVATYYDFWCSLDTWGRRDW
jgi:RHS repeat-associated protein